MSRKTNSGSKGLMVECTRHTKINPHLKVTPVTPCTIVSKIYDTPKGVYLPISKLHSILAVVILVAHNNLSQICYCGQIHYRVQQIF